MDFWQLILGAFPGKEKLLLYRVGQLNISQHNKMIYAPAEIFLHFFQEVHLSLLAHCIPFLLHDLTVFLILSYIQCNEIGFIFSK